ncbi:MAG TPA: hypothetical protein VKZ18_05175 [Polyangia bacterium]|nr:hypothetical protein [Polyangia bacterium]
MLLAAALAALGAAACVSGFDRNDQTVNSLRILGAAAHVADTSSDCVTNGNCVDWADAEAGDTVTFQALVANPTNFPVVMVTWVTCLPSTNNTVTPCTSEAVLRNPADLIMMAKDPSTGVIQLGVGETIQFTVPQEVSYLTQQLITRAEDPTMLAAQCSLFIEAPVIIIAQGGDGTTVTSTVTALKYLRLSPWSQIGPTDMSNPALQHYVRNFNPSISALNIPNDDTACLGQTLVQSCTTDADCSTGGPCSSDGWCPPAAMFPAGTSTVCGQIPDGDIQTYYYCGMDGVDGSEMEYPSITWYETAGTEAGVANKNTAGTPDLAARTFQVITRPTGPFTLYGVVRDGRDGENWIAQAFQ